jgi:hypothetical protein
VACWEPWSVEILRADRCRQIADGRRVVRRVDLIFAIEREENAIAPRERAVAEVGRWIFGVLGLIRAGQTHDGLGAPAACDADMFRLHYTTCLSYRNPS